MKNTHDSVFRLLMFMILLIALAPSKLFGQSGATCATPISISDTYCSSSLTASDTTKWYAFTATRTDGEIQLTNSSSPGYTKMFLYSGSCAGLTLRDTSRSEHFGYTLDYSGLTVSTTYYLKLTKSGTTSVGYGICFINSIFSLTCTTCYNSGCELVCNGSFENCSAYPNTYSQINNVYCWGNVGGVAGSADQYNANGTAGFGVPTNPSGSENAHTGSGYGGFIAFKSSINSPSCPTYREYICGKLGTTLTAGDQYRVSFWVSLADNSGYQTGKIGAYLSAAVPTQACWGPLTSCTPQVVDLNIISLSTNWQQITGVFTASGGEQYITIGTFASALPVQSHSPSAAPMTDYAYYFVDDVSVIPQPSITVTQSPVGACINMPVTLTAVPTAGTPTSYSWSWSQGSATCVNPSLCSQQTFANTFSTPTTYTVTSTLFTGCTVTNTFTISPGTNGLTVNAGVDQTICTGGTTTLTGSATGSYNTTSWKILNSTTLCTGCTTVTVTPPVGITSYVYTVSNSVTGCISMDTVKVTTVPLAVTIVSPPGASVCGGWFNFTTANAYSTYSWSVNTVNNSGGNTSTLSALWGTPYDTLGVTGTVYVSVVDANGCQGSASLTIPSCCPFKVGQSTSYPNLINDSTSRVDNVTYPSLFTYNTANLYYEAKNKNFSINGIYVVDRNTRLQGCEVKLGPNAKIIIRPGIKFELTDSTGSSTFTKLYACSDMWDGIYVDGTNTATKLTILNRTVIEDAKNAVVSTNGGNFFIDGGTQRVKFNKNNIGVLIKPFAGVHPGVIRRAIFSCDAPNQLGGTFGVTLAGPNCRAPISGIGFAGVYVETCNAVTIGDSTSATFRNDFQRTQYGIYSKGSNVKVWNNNFKYFTNTIVNKSLAPNGIAVYATAGKFNAKYLTVGRQGNYKAKNKFTKCSYGVFAQNYMNLNCEFNRFDSCMTAGISTLNCLSTTILINKDTLTECTGTNISCVQVNGSTVNITSNLINNTQSNNATNFGQTGIYVANAVLVNVALKIQYNTIKKMRNGIWVTRVKGAKITDNNPITFIPSTSYTVGSPARGIVMQETNNSLVRANTVTYNGTLSSTDYSKIYGVYVQDCHGDTVSKNSLTNVGSGIFLKNNDKPSVIACNTMTTCKVGINFGYVNSVYTPVALDSQLVWGTTNSPTGNTWIGMSTVPSLQGRITGAPNGIAWYYNTNSNATPANWNLFANSFTNGNNPTSLGSATNQCSQMLSPPQLTPSQMRDRMLGNIVKAPSTYDTLNAQFRYAEKVYAYRSLRENPSWKSLGTSNDSYYSGFYTTESATNIGKFANVEDSLNSGKVAGATSILSTITPAGTYEVNRKTLLGIYIATWAVDSMKLAATQEATLLSIANQHPLMGGNAVYDARVMLNYEVNDSSSMRMIEEPFSSTSEDPSVGHVYPNPTTGNFTIAADIPEGKNGTMELFDLTGRKVMSFPIIGGQMLHAFSGENLPEGVYIYQVRLGETILASDRLVIIHE